MEFITKYSESVKKGTMETIDGPSMTEPDNSMSIPEIIARFTRGQGIQVPVRPWESAAADEDGQPMQDVDLSDFMGVAEPAPASPDPAPSATPAVTPAAVPPVEPAASQETPATPAT